MRGAALSRRLGDKLIMRPDGRLVWTLQGYEFLGSELAPDTVHPGLWRHARVNMANGLYSVTDRVYQLRGFDVSNMTIIEGDTGLIVIDPLISTEVAKAAMELYLKHGRTSRWSRSSILTATSIISAASAESSTPMTWRRAR